MKEDEGVKYDGCKRWVGVLDSETLISLPQTGDRLKMIIGIRKNRNI